MYDRRVYEYFLSRLFAWANRRKQIVSSDIFKRHSHSFKMRTIYVVGWVRWTVSSTQFHCALTLNFPIYFLITRSFLLLTIGETVFLNYGKSWFSKTLEPNEAHVFNIETNKILTKSIHWNPNKQINFRALKDFHFRYGYCGPKITHDCNVFCLYYQVIFRESIVSLIFIWPYDFPIFISF